MDFVRIGNTYIALLITFGLMLFHYCSPYLLQHRLFQSLRFASFAGGAAISYVFLHMLPGLIEAKAPIGKILGNLTGLSPFFDTLIFIVALLGFNVYYGLECLAEYQAEHGHSQYDAYYLHLLMYGVSNFLITYTMPLRVQTNLGFALIFTCTMGLHFILVDRRFNAHFSKSFSQGGRSFLFLSLFAGWFVSAITNPINVELVSFVVAFLSGSVLYGSFREELPSIQGAKFFSFSLGLVSVGALLMWQTHLAAAIAS